jgi:phenylalanyl-tRNA synthetase beta chain
LLPGLLGALEHNVRAGAKRIRLFELGRVFGSEQREEQTHLGLVMAGAGALPGWRTGNTRDADLFDLKGAIFALGLGELEFRREENAALVISVGIFWGEQCIGHIGQLHPAHARELDVAAPVAVAEINISLLPLEDLMKRKFVELDKYPAITRDVAMIVPRTTEHAQVLRILQGANEPLLAAVELFDVFTDPTGEKVEVERKSLAYSLTYRAKDRTLQADEASAAHQRLKQRLKGELDVQFRE